MVCIEVLVDKAADEIICMQLDESVSENSWW
jgi:hypothetical protein